MLAIVLAFTTLYREQAVEKAHVLARKKLTEGTSLGGTAPVGYEYEVTGTDKNGKKLLGWLVPKEPEATVVREAFTLFARGGSLGKVADHLNVAGVRTRATKKAPNGNPWVITSARDFLRREVYIGVRTRGKDYREEGAHEALVDDVTWKRVQRRLKPKADGPVHRTRGEGHVLGEGLIRCSVCGRGMVVGSANGKTRTLRCVSRGGGHPSITYSKAEDYLLRLAVERLRVAVKVGGNSEQVAEAEARVREAREDLAEVEEMLGTAAPANSKQRLALEEAEDALAALDRSEEQILRSALPGSATEKGWTRAAGRDALGAREAATPAHDLRGGQAAQGAVGRSRRECRPSTRAAARPSSTTGPEGTITKAQAAASNDEFWQHVASAEG